MGRARSDRGWRCILCWTPSRLIPARFVIFTGDFASIKGVEWTCPVEYETIVSTARPTSSQRRAMFNPLRSLLMDTGEPFGLPKGTVRGVLALGFSTATIYMWVTGQPVPNEMLATTVLIVGNYFGTRGAGDAPSPAPEAPLPAPYVPGDPEAEG